MCPALVPSLQRIRSESLDRRLGMAVCHDAIPVNGLSGSGCVRARWRHLLHRLLHLLGCQPCRLGLVLLVGRRQAHGRSGQLLFSLFASSRGSTHGCVGLPRSNCGQDVAVSMPNAQNVADSQNKITQAFPPTMVPKGPPSAFLFIPREGGGAEGSRLSKPSHRLRSLRSKKKDAPQPSSRGRACDGLPPWSVAFPEKPWRHRCRYFRTPPLSPIFTPSPQTCKSHTSPDC